jgi:hypothetical protein
MVSVLIQVKLDIVFVKLVILVLIVLNVCSFISLCLSLSLCSLFLISSRNLSKII